MKAYIYSCLPQFGNLQWRWYIKYRNGKLVVESARGYDSKEKAYESIDKFLSTIKPNVPVFIDD